MPSTEYVGGVGDTALGKFWNTFEILAVVPEKGLNGQQHALYIIPLYPFQFNSGYVVGNPRLRSVEPKDLPQQPTKTLSTTHLRACHEKNRKYMKKSWSVQLL